LVRFTESASEVEFGHEGVYFENGDAAQVKTANDRTRRGLPLFSPSLAAGKPETSRNFAVS
jgi:hypothetical protein